MSLEDRLRSGLLSRRDVLKLGLAGLALISCGGVNKPPIIDPDPDPDPDYDPTLPPQNPRGMSAVDYWSAIGGHSGVDVSRIRAGSEDNSVAWFLDWLNVRMQAPVSGPRFSGSIGMVPLVAQSYVDRFGKFGNLSDQARLALETYFDARDKLTQTVDLRTGGPFVHPDAYVLADDVGLWYPHHGITSPGEDGDVWYPIAHDSRPEDTGLLPNPRFLGVAFTDLNPEPNTSVMEQDAVDNWLSPDWDSCSWNVTQDYPSNAPGFSYVVDKAYADSLPGGLPFLSAFPWSWRVESVIAYPGNTQMRLKATQIDRALVDAQYLVMSASHLGPSPIRYDGWEYDDDFGVPAVGQLIPPMMNGERTVISSVSTQLSSRFADVRFLADSGFGADVDPDKRPRLYNPARGTFLWDHRLLDPFDMRPPSGTRLGIADGGRVHRPVWDSSDPSRVSVDRVDNRSVSPCSNSPGGLVYLPDGLTVR
jgi:hypothetical protein